MRKGQVTIFFAIGITLLLIILLILYISAPNKETPDEPNLLNNPSLNQYLSSCVDFALIDGIRMIGENGAFMNKEYDETIDGYVNGPPNERVATFNGVQKVVAIKKVDYPATNDLPTPKAPATQIFEKYNGFGEITYPRLCSVDGPNNKTQTENQHCPTYAYPNFRTSKNIFQESFSRALEEAVDDCLDQEQVGDRIDVDLTDALGTSEVEIIFAEKSITARVTFPGSPSSVMEKTYPFRLMTLYGYMIEALVLNTRDPRNLIENSPDSGYYRGEFNIRREPMLAAADDGIYYHVIVFEDESMAYSYGGQQLALKIYVEQRDPAFLMYDPDD